MEKKKDSQRKQKKDEINATVEVVDGKLEIAYDDRLAGFSLDNLVSGSLYQKVTYERQSGKEKVVLSAPCSDGVGRLQNIDNFKKNFDFLFAVDTNTEIINGERIALSASCCIPHTLASYKGSIPFIGFSAFIIYGVVDRVNPETIGWHFLVETLRNGGMLQQNKRIGIIVDSELDKIVKMNQRNLPYYEEYYLPKEIQFIYASSDTGKEFLPNQMISACDKIAKERLNLLSQKTIPTNPKPSKDKNFRGYGIIKILMT